jgi:hypothetical protein
MLTIAFVSGPFAIRDRAVCNTAPAWGWLVAYYWKVIISVRLSVGAFGFKGWLVRLPLP